MHHLKRIQVALQLVFLEHKRAGVIQIAIVHNVSVDIDYEFRATQPANEFKVMRTTAG